MREVVVLSWVLGAIAFVYIQTQKIADKQRQNREANEGQREEKTDRQEEESDE
jgi:hypothetical protein